MQEIKTDNLRLRQLTRELREVFLHGRPDGMRRYDLLEMLEEFRDQLATHFALEEAFGYFDDPVAVAPRLNEQVVTLRSQHEQLFQCVCDLVERADDLFRRHPMNRALRELCSSFLNFEHRLEEHEAHENELIMQAFNDDIGVGD